MKLITAIIKPFKLEEVRASLDMLGISGFYPKFVKKYASLNRIIEKAVKKYTRDIKLNKFPTKKNFLDG